MSEWKGDFLGFTYGGIHSSDLGIVRVSDGSRFSESLLPTQTERIVNIPGRDETYFFGSDNTQKQFNISFAFDSMTEKQLNDLHVLFANKTIKELKFNERGDIIWKAKVKASSIKYIPFDIGEDENRYKLPSSITERECAGVYYGEDVPPNSLDLKGWWYVDKNSLSIWWKEFEAEDYSSWYNWSDDNGEKAIDNGKIVYKGEGTVQFVCYQPYGIEKIESFPNKYYPEPLPEESEPKPTERTKVQFEIDNSFYSDSDWKIIIAGIPDSINWIVDGVDNTLSFKREKIKEFYELSGTSAIAGIIINSKTGFVQGVYDIHYSDENSKKEIVSWQVSPELSNEFMSGSFLKIPANRNLTIQIIWSIEEENPKTAKLFYERHHY